MSVITQELGLKAFKLIEHIHGKALPRTGVIAGQSLCSAILYLLGKSKVLEINDIDIFVKDLHKTPRWDFIKQTFVANPVKSSYSVYDLHRYSLLEGIHATEEEKKNIFTPTEYDEDTLSVIEGKRRIVREKIFEFNRPSQIYGNYSIKEVSRRGLLNYVFVAASYSHKLNPYTIINSFDINCTQVAFDLRTKRLYFTPYFEHFVHTLHMIALRIDKTHHTVVRYMQKKQQHGYFGNIEELMVMAQTYLGVAELQKDSPLFEMAKADGYEYLSGARKANKILSANQRKVSKFGKTYAEKYKNLHNIKEYARLYSHRQEIKFNSSYENVNEKFIACMTDNEKYEYFNARQNDLYHPLLRPRDTQYTQLSKLKFRVDADADILSGKHKCELEKQIGLTIHNYHFYAQASMPAIMHDRFNTFNLKFKKKKLIKQVLVDGSGDYDEVNRILNDSVLGEYDVLNPLINPFIEYYSLHSLFSDLTSAQSNSLYEKINVVMKDVPLFIYAIGNNLIASDFMRFSPKQALLYAEDLVNEVYIRFSARINSDVVQDLLELNYDGLGDGITLTNIQAPLIEHEKSFNIRKLPIPLGIKVREIRSFYDLVQRNALCFCWANAKEFMKGIVRIIEIKKNYFERCYLTYFFKDNKVNYFSVVNSHNLSDSKPIKVLIEQVNAFFHYTDDQKEPAKLTNNDVFGAI